MSSNYLTVIFPIILLSISLISIFYEILIYSSFYSNAENIGGLLGNRFARSLIITLVLYFPWKKLLKKKNLNFIFLFSLVFFIISSYQHIHIYKLNKSLKETSDLQTLFKDFESYIKDIEKNKDENTQIFKKEDYGELTDYSKILQNYFSEIQYKMQQLNIIIESLDFDNSLDESILSNIDSILIKQKDLKIAIAVLDSFNNIYSNLFTDTKNHLDKMNNKSKIKSDIIRGSKRGIDDSFPNIEAYFKIEKENFSCLLDILSFMQSIFGQYSFSDNILIFSSDSDVTKYNKLIERLNLTAENEQKWFDEQNLQINQTINQLNKLIK